MAIISIFNSELRKIWSDNIEKIKLNIEMTEPNVTKQKIKHGDYGYFYLESLDKKCVRLFLTSLDCKTIHAFDPFDNIDSDFGRDVNKEKPQYTICGNLEMPVTSLSIAAQRKLNEAKKIKKEKKEKKNEKSKDNL